MLSYQTAVKLSKEQYFLGIFPEKQLPSSDWHLTKNNMYDLKIIGGIGEWTLTDFLKAVEEKDWEQNDTFRIYICSNGGQAEPSYAIKNFIDTHKMKVIVYAGGKCESAAAIILSAGTKRYAYRNCMFMFHLGSMDTKKKEKEGWKKLGYFNGLYNQIIPKVSLTKKPHYITAEEALAHGIIDRII